MKFRRQKRRRYNDQVDLSGEGVVEKRMNIPGYYYDPAQDTYFRIEQGFSSPPTSFQCVSRQQTDSGPVIARRTRNILSVMHQHSIGRLSEEDRLQFALQAAKRESCSSTKMEPPYNQVLIHHGTSCLLFVSHSQIINRRLSFPARRPLLGDSELVYRGGGPLTAVWANYSSKPDTLIMLQRAAVFKQNDTTRIDLLRLDERQQNMSEIFSITLDSVLSRVGTGQTYGLTMGSYVRCLEWSEPDRSLLLGVERQTLLYRAEKERTEIVKCSDPHSFALIENQVYVGKSRGVAVFDLRHSQIRPTVSMKFDDDDVVIRQLKAIKNGRYLLAEGQAGQIYQSDVRCPGRAMATMRNGPADSCRCIPFHVDENEEVLTCGQEGHGIHLWNLRTNSLVRCLTYSENLVTAAFKRTWNSIIVFSKDDMLAFTLP